MKKLPVSLKIFNQVLLRQAKVKMRSNSSSWAIFWNGLSPQRCGFLGDTMIEVVNFYQKSVSKSSTTRINEIEVKETV